ncbi:lipoprotein signal peptidase [Saccharicrinis aurantiacus]|uniref:lipoprotein signal peptidase n=1 Tax=Saccharicrinis aurantiacus TaxID=1849719 RepID=UPI002493B244|nr:lipoprotein signal peptidase [Saccharicrinis aurantiacus]
MLSLLKRPIVIVALVLIVDQALKIWVKTNMMLGEEFNIIGDWFIIHFIENNGMAFGMELAGKFGKVLLSVFRIVAVFGIGYYLYQLTKKKAPTGLIVSISLVLAGALGNIIDSAFYGLLFSDSYPQVATFLPEGGGYASFLHGKVVDMFYFPLVDGYFPDWVPFWGGDHFVFFRPVFNVADSAISIGIGILLIFQRNYFKD